MLIEAFISLVNARGIQLKEIAGGASNVEGKAAPRRLSAAEVKLRKELTLSLDVEPTARGKGSRVPRKPVHSFADLAYAMGGLPRMPELAFTYSYAGWLGGFEELHRGLMLKSIQTMNQDRDWPMVVAYAGGRVGEPYDYVPKLATLVLIADAHKHAFITAPGLPSALIGMDDRVWARSLAGRYLELQRGYERWYTLGLAHVQKRVLGRMEEETA